MRKFLKFIITALLLITAVFFCVNYLTGRKDNGPTPAVQETIDEYGSYTSKEDVALYLLAYGKLPSNFITKSEARKLGWDALKGNLQKVCKGCSIGGDSFINWEWVLPYRK